MTQQVYLPTDQVRARYCVSSMTIWRWEHDESLAFPKPLRINRRRFWKLAELEVWEANRTETKEVADASAT